MSSSNSQPVATGPRAVERTAPGRGAPRLGLFAGLGFAFVAVGPVPSGADSRLSYGMYGTPGLIDMPVATMPDDADLGATFSTAGPTRRTSFTFQVLPRVSGSFRYSIIEDYDGAGVNRFDRSFDLRFALSEGQGPWPAVTVGLQDFLGTGLYSGEYVVATEELTPGLSLTGGIGWGRLGTNDGFSNPFGVLGDRFETRPAAGSGGGRVNFDNWFRGDAALFAGVSWQATDKLTLKAEYSSDAYLPETDRGLLDRSSPFNFGFSYRVYPQLELGGYYVNGSTVGLQLTTVLNPKSPPSGATPDAAPPPVALRGVSRDLGWPAAPVSADPDQLRDRVASRLVGEGIALDGIARRGDTLIVRIRSLRYRSAAQAIGRTARALTYVAPPDIERFRIVTVEQGMAISSADIARADLETLEHTPDAAERSLERAVLRDAKADGSAGVAGAGAPRFDWTLGPYLDTELFDPDDPVRADIGLRATGRLALGNGLFLSGSVRKKAFGTLDESTRPSTSVLPRVRSENAIYNREGDPAIENLLVESFFRPGDDLYGRVSAGYLEKMFGGVSAELLWKPFDKGYGLGAELNYARQRDFDQLFGFRDYDTVTGHVSGYYALGGGFHTQVDVGRYLAGDWGTTLSLDREFDNGFRIGAYATFTDVSFDDFGEGSFDKGIRVTIPLAWLIGRESRQSFDTTIRPVLRDGGARLDVPNRLYETVRGAHEAELESQWGRFWR